VTVGEFPLLVSARLCLVKFQICVVSLNRWSTFVTCYKSSANRDLGGGSGIQAREPLARCTAPCQLLPGPHLPARLRTTTSQNAIPQQDQFQRCQNSPQTSCMRDQPGSTPNCRYLPLFALALIALRFRSGQL